MAVLRTILEGVLYWLLGAVFLCVLYFSILFIYNAVGGLSGLLSLANTIMFIVLIIVGPLWMGKVVYEVLLDIWREIHDKDK